MNGFYLEASQKELVQFSLDMPVGKLSDIEAVVG
jgi:prophage maintenance system killer protein